MIISGVLVIIDYVIDKTRVLICCAYIRGFFESQYYINTVGDVDWVLGP